MVKVYKVIDGVMQYWESWENEDDTTTIHWGVVGEVGKHKSVDSSDLNKTDSKIKKELDDRLSFGYMEIIPEDHRLLIIEYKASGNKEEDLDQLYDIEDSLNNALGWTGLGQCDGGDIKNDLIEVACSVVDFELAEKIVINELKGTKFKNYIRIFDATEDTSYLNN